MRIVFEQTGGFMGRKTNLTLDLNDLPDSQGELLRLLLDQADFLTLNESYPASSSSRDQFQYRVTVQTDDIEHTVQAAESSIPDSLRPLIDELSRLERTHKSR